MCAFGALVKEPLLSEHELLNVHPSLLPRWRGAAPVERAIMAGDARTGVSIMRLTAGLDSGPVCLRESLAIEPHDNYGSLAARLQALGGELLVRALDLIARGEPPEFVEQDEAGVTLRGEDRARGPAAGSRQSRGGAGARRPGAAPAHRRAPAARRRGAAGCAARLASRPIRGSTGRRRARSRARRRAAAVRHGAGSARAACACSRRAAARWTPAPTCAAMPL